MEPPKHILIAEDDTAVRESLERALRLEGYKITTAVNGQKALELADRAYVLVNGKVTIQGTGQELLKNQDIQAAYLEGGAKN